MDGQVFDFYDEVPERPHPDCRCTVEVIEAEETGENEKDKRKPVYPKDESVESEDEQEKNEKLPPEEKSWIMPCNGRITSPYGWRIHPIYKTKSFHSGWDIAVPIGTQVKAISGGDVLYAGNNDPKGYGQYVVINHGIINGVKVTSEYGHLSSWNVSYRQKVKQGEIIARSGNTGGLTGPHLHLTIRENGKYVDPGKYIKY